ncbi:head-to-tail adaptor [Gordonia phage Benczkowski14]|uniref:Head-to-tail adaptor n=4 Tax=Demosthenesvirus katyusha TaxID=1982108 RepID=A0A345MCF4_9CAUD|nr:head-tail adaptor [Gordonia phage Katyusha]AMS03412.1 head-to-tail adaptor [Gordonia phage Katyusha]AMS03729.1 head-to-tail adaptor [Gordonia phage Benczkowski14]AXH68175.1 head-to-tail adaptor [Gordonia phage Teatealatte]QBP29577.1 head-to-tail adaptor [Gordonia phage Tredge]
MARPAYTDEDSVKTHLRNVRLQAGVTYEGMIEAASNEVDGHLGTRYKTPIDVTVSDPSQTTAAYWLSNVTSMIAAGRYLMATSAGGSHDSTHNYGSYLVGTAMALIRSVQSGKTDLSGIETLDGVEQGPIIINQDAYSQVDLFYDNMHPEGFMPGRTTRGDAPWPR